MKESGVKESGVSVESLKLGARSVEWVPPGQVRPNQRNARTHSQKQVRQIAESIKAFGFNNQGNRVKKRVTRG